MDNDKGKKNNTGATCSQLQTPQAPQYSAPDLNYMQYAHSMAAPLYPVWGSVTPGISPSGQTTPISPGTMSNDLVTMIIKRLDSMDSKLAQLDSIQTSVNTVNTR